MVGVGTGRTSPSKIGLGAGFRYPAQALLQLFLLDQVERAGLIRLARSPPVDQHLLIATWPPGALPR